MPAEEHAMGFTYLKRMPEPAEILAEIPLPAALAAAKAERDRAIKAVLSGEDARFLLVIGPCSADEEAPVLEYATRLARLQETVREQLILIPRIYTNKPRTTGEGYKGMMHQPDPVGAPDIVEGIKALRRLHVKAFAETGLSAADEMLYPENLPYVEDLLSYIAVGARSVENQQHRLTVSGVEIPVGMKNPTSGDLGVMLNSVMAAQLPHQFVYNRFQVETSGNPYAHAILRGAVDHHGRSIPNFHYENISELIGLYEKRKLQHPAILIDANHANSDKKPREQVRIAHEIMTSRRLSPAIRTHVKGLMIESYLVEGAQDPAAAEKIPGKSITDPCLGWDDSARLVREIAELV
jgi:3-deoxy-7-phosphoheptulonate synthase